ncbi:MAG: hypothetical protein OXP28_15940 [Gammaproteobacteria bacterium]|nr:hypothetical protein [Gammaproteobacteria bacterium]
MMDQDTLAQELAARYQRAAVAGHDIHVAFAIASRRPLVCRMTPAGIIFDESLSPEATFYFDCEETLLSLLGGGGDFVSAFMRGAFRSDGHITLIFLLLMAFTPNRATLPSP